MNIDKKAIILVLVLSVVLSGCFNDKTIKTGSNFGPRLENSDQTYDVSDTKQIGIEVQASEERIDRSNPNWLKHYCVSRIMEIGALPSSYERQRGPFIGLSPVYLSERHTGFEDKVTCSLDYYIWPVRDEAFLSLGVDYAYSAKVWNEYYEALTASKSGSLKDEGWKELVNEGEVGVKPDYAMSYFNSTEGLREYLDIFYTNDEEVVYELLVVNTGGR